MSLLVFENVHKSYGETRALAGVTLAVQPGEVVGLLGPNGAGKSTLIRILMDIIRPDAGSVRVFGEAFRRAHLDRIGYLPEERGLYLKQRVVDVMVYFGVLKGLERAEARRRAQAWLARMELGHVERWRVSQLSKGMGQKVQIASVFLPDPELCVLDEPFSGLDPINVRLVQDLIGERRRAGRTTILSTHQMNQVERLCQRVALIHQGELLVEGDVRDVRERFSRPEVRVGLASGPPPPIPGVATQTDEGDGSWRLLLESGVSPARVLAALVAAGKPVERFERVLTPMEDIFIRVVQRREAA